LRLAYQPILHLDTGNVAGMEALCRFDDGASPEQRFQECETLGLAADLDLVIIDRALGDLGRIPDGYLSINLSPSTLLDPRLADVLLGPSVPADRIVLEVTEHARIADYEKAEEQLAAIRASGIRLAVDDAGAGYATFRHILSLRPDIIKMDRSITQDIDSDTARRALATALVIFGGEIGATLIAEGVETTDEILALRRAGIHRAQGFALARPAPLPIEPIEYEPLSIADVLDLPAMASEASPSVQAATEGVRAHGLLAAVDAIGAVLDMLNERLATIGEDRYRGLVGTAQRQARHVGSVLRDTVRGVPDEPAFLGIDDRAPNERGSFGLAERRRLQKAMDALGAAQTEVDDAVFSGRRTGATWDEIAKILGMTRQGASKHYRRLQSQRPSDDNV
jgi:EAL domain-containing protein (putative c-di-GMP-specific phosphodiesterase class I)